jgi:hypothetical protein
MNVTINFFKCNRKFDTLCAMFGITTFFFLLICSPNIMRSFGQAQAEALSIRSQNADSFSTISRGLDPVSLSLAKSFLVYENISQETDFTPLSQQTSNQTSSNGSDSFSDISRGIK